MKPFNLFNDFDPFDENDGLGKAAHDLDEVLEHLSAGIEAQKITTTDAIDALLNIMRPGATDSSHDILQLLNAALYTLDAPRIAEAIGAAWLCTFPWGLGLHLGFHENFEMGDADKVTLTRALFGVMRSGGAPVSLNAQGKIVIVDDEGIEHIVSAFREELDATEPTEPSPDERTAQEWLKRWMPS